MTNSALDVSFATGKNLKDASFEIGALTFNLANYLSILSPKLPEKDRIVAQDVADVLMYEARKIEAGRARYGNAITYKFYTGVSLQKYRIKAKMILMRYPALYVKILVTNRPYYTAGSYSQPVKESHLYAVSTFNSQYRHLKATYNTVLRQESGAITIHIKKLHNNEDHYRVSAYFHIHNGPTTHEQRKENTISGIHHRFAVEKMTFLRDDAGYTVVAERGWYCFPSGKRVE